MDYEKQSVPNNLNIFQLCSSMSMYGLTIPDSWCDTLCNYDYDDMGIGRTNYLSLFILADLVDRYRIEPIYDEKLGKEEIRKKFDTEYPQVGTIDYARRFNADFEEVDKALAFLQREGVIKRYFNLSEDGNILAEFIKLKPDMLLYMTYPWKYLHPNPDFYKNQTIK